MNLHLSTLTVALAMALAPLVACSDTGETDTTPDGGGPVDAGLSFVDAGTLELTPGEEREVSVRGPSDAKVRFLLLGETSDASLTPAEIKLDGKGRGSVTLKAPTKVATFVLLAQSGDASAELTVAVSQQGFLSLRVVPQYAGMRELSEPWVADVLVGGDCAGLLATYPQAPIGQLSGSADIGESPVVESVPIGALLAVGLRSGSLVEGCTVVDTMSAKDELETVVLVNDQPMVLPGASMDLDLEFDADPTGYADIVKAGVEAVSELAFPSELDTTDIVLEQMLSTLDPASSDSLYELSQSSSLATNVAAATSFDARQYCLDLGDAATTRALAGLDAGTAKVEGTIVGTEGSPGEASFEVDSFIGLDPMVTPLEPITFAWADTGNDSILITGTIPVSGARLAAAYMSAVVADDLDAESVPLALQAGLDCGAVATAILETGEVEGCGHECLTAACEAAVDARWALGLDADEVGGAPLSTLTVAASGPVKLGSELAPEHLMGSWSGTLTSLGKVATAQGAAKGSPTPPE